MTLALGLAVNELSPQALNPIPAPIEKRGLMVEIREVARLPETRDTLVAALAADAPADRTRALDLIARAYRDPVAHLLALRWTLARER